MQYAYLILLSRNTQRKGSTGGYKLTYLGCTGISLISVIGYGNVVHHLGLNTLMFGLLSINTGLSTERLNCMD